jgi:hypothetical protein
VSFARLHDRIHRLEERIVVIEPAVDVGQMRALALVKGNETGHRLTSAGDDERLALGDSTEEHR